MKKQLWQAVLMLAVLATLPAMGQTNRGDTIVNVPFAFRAANQTLPAGRYTITRIDETNLRFADSHGRSVFVQTHSEEGKAPEGHGRVVFHRYGNSYFLSEVWVAAKATGRKAFPMRAEQELAATETESELAVLQIGR
jgi:hypothetical protein